MIYVYTTAASSCSTVAEPRFVPIIPLVDCALLYTFPEYILPSRPQANSTNKSFVPHLRRMLEPEVTDTHIYYPHHMLPRFNQIRTENAPLGAFHLSAHVAAQPTPVPNRPPKLLAAYTSDPVFQLSRKKEVHLTRLRQLRHRYDVFVNHKSFKKAMQNHAGRKDVHLNCVREFAEELEHDPDEYFDGGYDWYWSGSTMAVIPRPEGGDWLVHVEASDGQLNQLSECFYLMVFSIRGRLY